MRHLALALVVFLMTTLESSAAPRTWVQPSMSLLGATSESRFGAQVECSNPIVGPSARSLIAIGAPRAAVGEGRVFLFDPADANSPVQVVAPDEQHGVSGFGVQLQFIDDINGDGRDDLIVATTATLGGSSGRVYGFISSGSDTAPLYGRCGSIEYSGGIQARVQGIRSAPGSDASNVVIALPELSQTFGYRLTLGIDSVSCVFEASPAFTTASTSGSEYGTSLAQIGVEGGSTVALGVGAPASTLAGTVSVLKSQEGLLELPSVAASSTTLPGSVVAGRYQSTAFAVGAPQNSNGRGSLTVYQNSFSGVVPVCTTEIAAAEPSEAFGSVIAVIGQTFIGLTGSGMTSVLARRTEESTGGAIVIFSASATGCSQMYELNNCQNDPSQEQGSALAGGDTCVTTYAGTQRRMLLFGSPGWNNGRGRVDISIEGDEQSTPTNCEFIESPATTPTLSVDLQSEGQQLQTSGTLAVEETPFAPTLTPTPPVSTSPTANPTPNLVVTTPEATATDSPAPTPTNTVITTATYTATPASTNSASPPEINSSPSATESALPSNSPAATTPEVGATAMAAASVTSAHSEGITTTLVESDSGPLLGSDVSAGGSQNDGAVRIQDITPIPVYPGVTGLPAPEITVQGSTVTVIMPEVTPRLQPQNYQKAQRQLMKQRKMSANKARNFIDNPDNLVVTYIFTYRRVSEARRFSFISTAYAADRRSAKKDRVIKVRSRQNTITLQRMPPGTFQGSYSVEVSLKKSRVIVGQSAPSAPTQFRVDG